MQCERRANLGRAVPGETKTGRPEGVCSPGRGDVQASGWGGEWVYHGREPRRVGVPRKGAEAHARLRIAPRRRAGPASSSPPTAATTRPSRCCWTGAPRSPRPTRCWARDTGSWAGCAGRARRPPRTWARRARAAAALVAAWGAGALQAAGEFGLHSLAAPAGIRKATTLAAKYGGRSRIPGLPCSRRRLPRRLPRRPPRRSLPTAAGARGV